ncbi:MAG TPA: methyltransferase domain-containing protein [Kofleriaceae bacterium]|nr:methyltransferase domain-containing protein [Kofleriaceae bacterium]
MIADLVVCPACRTREGDRIELRTLDREDDWLVCECGQRCPIVDGIPIVMADPARLYRDEITTIVERELDPAIAAALVAHGPDDAPYPRLLEHLSLYLDAHWGDRAEPPPEHEGFGARSLVERIAALPAVDHAVELGCSAGRIVATLARSAAHVVGIDLHVGALRRARRLFAGEPVRYARRMTGRHYATATIAAQPLANVTLVAGDALDPPLVPLSFGRVVALNVLDSVTSPHQLLAVLDGLCAPGGELIVASPFTWQSGVVADHHRFGPAPADELARIVETGLGARYQLVERADLPWSLRRDARSAMTYEVHYIRARKA